MFTLPDHRLHLVQEPQPRDVDAATLHRLLETGAACRPPIQGTVYGTLLNDHATLEAMGSALHEAPYKAPPKAPVLYVKPRNTQAGHGATVGVPDDAVGVQVGGSLGIVIGRTAVGVSEAEALDYVAGYVIVADLCVPHESVYRPSVRFRSRDGFCVSGPALVARRHVADPDALTIRVRVGSRPLFETGTAGCVRSVARLLADVTEFMTLSAGDVLTMGVAHGAPVGHVGDAVRVQIADWEPLRFSLVADQYKERAE